MTTVADELDRWRFYYIRIELESKGFIQCALDLSEHTADGSSLHATTHTMYKYLRKDAENELSSDVHVYLFLSKRGEVLLFTLPLYLLPPREVCQSTIDEKQGVVISQRF